MTDIAKDTMYAGATDVTRYVMLYDATTGAEAVSVTITDIDLSYVRNQAQASAKVDATGLFAEDDPHADNQMYEVDPTDCPGLYRVDWPDAAFATGVDKVILYVKCVGYVSAVEEITLKELIALPGQEAPPLTGTADTFLSYLYKMFRNRKRQTTTGWELYDDTEAVVDQKAVCSDAASISIKQEVVSGP